MTIGGWECQLGLGLYSEERASPNVIPRSAPARMSFRGAHDEESKISL